MSKRQAVLKTKLKILLDECNSYLDDRAQQIKETEAPTIPFVAIRQNLTRGQGSFEAAWRLLSEEN